MALPAALARRTARGRTVLHCAAAQGDLATVRALLDAAPREALQELLVAPDRKQRPCALLACQEGRKAAARALVAAQGSFAGAAREAGAMLLVHACECDSTSLARALLAKRADPNQGRPTDGATPVIAATGHGSLQVLVFLLEQPGLNTACAEPGSGRTALHLACQLGHSRIVEVLLAHGANAKASAPGGRTPLYVAAEHGCLSCVEVLLRDGGLDAADISRANARYATPLSVAQRRGHSAVADTLQASLDSAKSCRGPRLAWASSPGDGSVAQGSRQAPSLARPRALPDAPASSSAPRQAWVPKASCEQGGCSQRDSSGDAKRSGCSVDVGACRGHEPRQAWGPAAGDQPVHHSSGAGTTSSSSSSSALLALEQEQGPAPLEARALPAQAQREPRGADHTPARHVASSPDLCAQAWEAPVPREAWAMARRSRGERAVESPAADHWQEAALLRRARQQAARQPQALARAQSCSQALGRAGREELRVTARRLSPPVECKQRTPRIASRSERGLARVPLGVVGPAVGGA